VARLLRRSRDHGGVTAIILGRMGSGKTTFMLSYLALPLMETGEKLLWRGGPFCQWGYLQPSRVKLLLDEALGPYRWIDRRRGKPCDPEKLGLEVVYPDFESPRDVIWELTPGKLCVAYTGDEAFMDLMEAVNSRSDIDWVSIFHDEVQKLAPSNVEGDMWRRNKRLADIIAETRKNYVSFYCAAQDYADVDYRVFRKMMYRVYLQDARPPRSSLVYRWVPHRLELGEAIIEGSTFAKATFQPLKRQLHLVVKYEG